jgi:periplasmic protein TonB
MKTEQLLTASLVDIVFDGRNKNYGAYELRQHYQKRIGKALLIMGLFFSAACILAVNAGTAKDHGPRVRISGGAMITSIKTMDPPPEKKPDKPKEPEKPVKTEKYLADIKLVDKDDITPPPSNDDLKNADVGDKKKEGEDFVNKQIPKPDDIPATKEKENNGSGDELVPVVEIEAKYPGDWKKFLERNLNPEVPVSNAAPEGRYSVVIQFIVDREGNVSEINALTHHGYGMEQEAIRVIKKAPKWEPAFQNGVHVKAYRKQVIVFEVLGE